MKKPSGELVRAARKILRADFIETTDGGKLPVVHGRKENVTTDVRELARYVIEQAETD